MRPFVYFLIAIYSFPFLERSILLVLAALFALPQLSIAQSPEKYHAFEVVPPSFFHVSNAPYNHYPGEIVDFNGKAAFKQTVFSYYLWVSDGSIEGTVKISFPEWGRIMLENPHYTSFGNRSVVLGDKLFFTVEINNKHHIWATDGTQEGTYEVAGPTKSGYSTLRSMRAVGDRIVFLAAVKDEGDRIFLVNKDGTELQKITELNASPGSATISRSLATIGNNLYVGESDAKKRYLTKIDKQGNVNRVWQMPTDSTEYNRDISDLTEANDLIYFNGNDGKGSALWVFNGTTASRLFDPSKEAKQHRSVRNLTVVNDKVYYFSNYWDDELNYSRGDFSHDSRLYISDGTISGTKQV
ncbi:MAG: hypothetical protein WC967_03480 [Balneolaceae bacterium]